MRHWHFLKSTCDIRAPLILAVEQDPPSSLWGGGGGTMSPVDFKKWQCPLSLY